MKINGVTIAETFEPKTLVVPLGHQRLVFKYLPVFKFDEFEKLYPEPQPPVITKPGGAQSVAEDDPEYLKAFDDWVTSKSNWMILKSLSATEGLEWSKVQVKEPKTWIHVTEELTETLGGTYANKVIKEIANYSGFNSALIDKATEDFLYEAARTKSPSD